MSLDLNKCSGDCFSCIKSYKKKHRLQPGQKFEIYCDGIMKEEVLDELFKDIPQKDQQTAKSIIDPVTWAAENLDWHCLDPDGEIWRRKNPNEYYKWISKNPGVPIFGKSRYHRPYQANILRCSSQFKVARIGRQCLAADTLVLMSDGSWKEIDKIQPIVDSVVSVDKNYNLVPAKVLDKFSNGKRKTYKIKTKFGSLIRCTSDHQFLVVTDNVDNHNGKSFDKLKKKWISIKDGLSKGHKIAIPSFFYHEPKSSNNELCKLLGFFLSDGSSSVGQSSKFTNTTPEYLEEFEKLVNHFGTKVNPYKKGKGKDLIITNGRGKENPVRKILKDLNLIDITGPDKFIPDLVFDSTLNDIRDFLRNFWAGDGYISTYKRTNRETYKTEIGTLQESYKLVFQVKLLLLKFGIHSYIKEEGKCYRLVVSNKKSCANFLKNICPIPQKEEAGLKAQKNIDSISDKYSFSTNEIAWDYISKIEEEKIEEVWDIEVEENHNFIANGLVAHNCGKTESLVVSMLYHMFTKPGVAESEGFKIVVITPYLEQIELIYGRMIELIKSSSVLMNSVSHSVKSPNHTIQLFNGSRLKGFTAGTKSGSNAGSVRGQAANMLAFDESDYLSSGDMDAAFSIITNYPEASVWMSSTPTGKREKFYHTCHLSDWKEFHYPSSVNPLWDKKLERLFRSQLTEAGYKHEICLSKGTLVQTTIGNIPIEDIKTSHKLFSHTGEIINVINPAKLTGVKSVLSVTLPGERVVEATPDHGFPNRDFVKTDLSKLVELPVYYNRNYDKSNKKIIFARLVGYNLGDGHSCKNRYQTSFYSNTESDMEEVVKDIKSIWPNYKGSVITDIVRGSQVKSSIVNIDGQRSSVNISVSMTKELLEYGIVRGKKVEQEFRVPEFVRETKYNQDNSIHPLSLSIKCEFLAALFGAEGSSPRSSNGYSASTIALSMSKRIGIDGSNFFNDLQALFLELGIRSTWTSQIIEKNIVYYLYIYNQIDNIYRFFSTVGYRYSEEKENLCFYWKCYLETYLSALKEKQEKFDIAKSLRSIGYSFKDIIQQTGLTFSQVDKAVNNNRNPTRFYKEFIKFDDWYIKNIQDNAVFMQIISSKKLESSQTYNITVDSSDHSYLLSNNIRTFNCAIFGEQEEGVFQNAYVDAAKKNYKYGDYTYNPNWSYTIGVDWNDTKNGSCILVLGFNPRDKKYYVVDRYIVSREGWTQLVACNKIAELNKLWNPIHIYVDVGFGSTQIEVLRQFSYSASSDPLRGPSHPDARIKNVLFGYDFSKKVETYDPITKQPIKKNAKGFLVESTVRRFEQQDIRISEHDKLLEKQLLGYIIKRVSQTGVPIYEATDETTGDHLLDALMLAVVSVVLEESPLGAPKHSSYISFSGRIGEANEGLIHEGDTVIYNNRKDNIRDSRDSHRPDMERWDGVTSEDFSITKSEVPAANTTRDNSVGLWSWDGFMSDSPKPKVRTLAEAKKEARKKLGIRPSRANMPKRKNI